MILKFTGTMNGFDFIFKAVKGWKPVKHTCMHRKQKNGPILRITLPILAMSPTTDLSKKAIENPNELDSYKNLFEVFFKQSYWHFVVVVSSMFIL